MAGDTPVNLAADNPYVTSFDAEVRSVDGREVTLDRTHFYAEGGGQPPDRGTIDGQAVTDVQKRNSRTVHTLTETPVFDAGEQVVGRIDEGFRTYVMCAHTASHVVYGAARELLSEHGYGGFDIGEERIRLDFETDSGEDALDALTIQRMANEVVWDGRSVEWYQMDAAEAEADEEIVFNLGEDVDVTDTVRIVAIEDWDVSACGGTHVRNTTEIGPIRVREVSNPGAGLVRVEYAVGPTAIRESVEQRRSATRAADAMDTNVRDLPEQVDRISRQNESLRREIEQLRETMLDRRLERLGEQPHTFDGEDWILGTVDSVGSNVVSERLADRAGRLADGIALAGRDGSTFVVVAADSETDAAAIVEAVTDEFGGGGGGRSSMAQGGGIDADPESVIDYLDERLRTTGWSEL